MTAEITKAAQGELLDFGGGRVRILVTTEQSGGGFFLLEDTAPRGKTTPLHRHPFEEAFYVLEGELLVHVDGSERLVGPGEVAVAPRGSAHAFIVTSESARFLGLITPGELGERFMREGGDPVTDPDAPTPPLDIAKVKAAGERTGAMEVLGPPPFSAPA